MIIKWGNAEPYSSVITHGFGSTAARFYIRNQTLAVKGTGGNTNNDFAVMGNASNQAGDIHSVQLINNAGFGRVLYEYST